MKEKILKRKLIRANHHFFEDQLEWLEENKAKTGETAAALLRRLIDEYRKTNKT